MVISMVRRATPKRVRAHSNPDVAGRLAWCAGMGGVLKCPLSHPDLGCALTSLSVPDLGVRCRDSTRHTGANPGWGGGLGPSICG